MGDKHGVPISTVAMGYVLSLPAVAGIIVGSRLVGDASSHIAANKQALELRLDEADLATIRAAQAHLTPVPGDCGDENRYPPYLSPNGNARDFEDEEALAEVERVVAAGGRVERSSGSAWEPVAVSRVQSCVVSQLTPRRTTVVPCVSGIG